MSRRISRQWPTYVLVLVLVTVMLIAGWAVIYLQSQRERELAMQFAVRQSQNNASALEQYVSRTLEGADLVTRHLADSYLRSGQTRSAHRPIVPRIIKDRVASGSTYAVLSVVSPSGDLLATSEAIAAKPSNVSKNPAFLLQSQHVGEDLVIGPPSQSRVLGDTFIHLTRRVLGEDGETIGFVGVQIRPRDLSHFTPSLRIAPSDLVSVIGLDGITRVRREGNRVSYGQDLRGRLVMRQQQRNPNGTYLGPSSLDGHVRYFTHRRLAKYPLFVTAGVSKDAALAPAVQRDTLLRTIMALVTLIIIVLAILILEQVRRNSSYSRSLVQVNSRLREAQRIAKVGYWEIDLKTEVVLWSDELFRAYEREQNKGSLCIKEYIAYFDAVGRDAFVEMLKSASSTGDEQICETKVVLPSGSASSRLLKARPVRCATGEIVSVVGTDQDVTAEKLVATLQEQISYLSRVDAMNIMASTLAHELSQPLAATSNFLEASKMALRRKDEAGRALSIEAVDAALGSVGVVGSIISRVRDMMRMERRKREPFQLSSVLDETVGALVVQSICSAEQIATDVEEDADLLWGDRLQVQQVLINLLKNACEAKSHQDDISITVRARTRADQFVEISVIDNGVGVREPKDLFSPLKSNKEGGLGLGLSISRTIVEYHGGRIWMSETGGSGTTITFTVAAEPD